MRMKRTNLVPRDGLLEEATRLSGEKTFSPELIRRHKARQIVPLAGSGLWEGDLAEIRAIVRARKHHSVTGPALAAISPLCA